MKLFHKLNGKWSEVISSNGGGNEVVGKDGKSAYEIALDKGFEGSEEEWLNSLKGTNGFNSTDVDWDSFETIQCTVQKTDSYHYIEATAPFSGLAVSIVQISTSITSFSYWKQLIVNQNTVECGLPSNGANIHCFYVNKGDIVTFRYHMSLSLTNQYFNFYPYKNTNNANNYSTDEQVIGTWINDKPLYRKTYQLTTPNMSTTETDYDLADVSDLNIDSFVRVYGTWNGFRDINTPNVNFSIGRNPSTNKLVVRRQSYTPISASILFSIEYTKTTD